jgi:anti-sigma factor RsiW
MNCDEVGALLAADVDGEIDALRSHALRKHVAGGPACEQRAGALRALKQGLRAELPYYRAPANLRERVAIGLRARVPTMVRPARGWRWFSAGALIGGLTAALLWFASSLWQQGGFGEDLPTRLVGLHTRATLGHQLIEVASSDRHTVKPWLSARLDYAIPVLDAADAGFVLLGARIDRLDGRPVAVLVYRHGHHIIDVHVRPLAADAPPVGVSVVRGFTVAAAQGAQMSWLATSDLNAAELTAFVTALANGRLDTAGG